jgi:hypothetical protein
MKDLLVTVLVPLLVGIVPAIISYFGIRSQMKIQVATMNKQQEIELLKLKELQASELLRIKEQQQAEIQKIREQSLFEMEKMKAEIDKQAELYEKNAQVDVTKDVFARMLSGDMSAVENIAQMESYVKKMQSGTHKNVKHPATNKKRSGKKFK